ncbi:MAG: ABC transporter transmembrane domain-containing protein [Hyphomicrobiales bacterium]
MADKKQKAGAGSILLSPRLKKYGLVAGNSLKIGPATVLVSAVINILSMALPLSILIVYDRIVPNASYESLSVLAALLISFALLEAGLRVCRAYALGWSAAKFELQTTIQSLDRILTVDYKSLNSVPAVKQAERLKAVSRYADFMGSQSRLAVVDLPYVLLFMSVMAMIGGWLALVPVIVIAIFSIMVLVLSGRFRRVLEERKQQDTKIYDFISELLGGIHTIKGAAMEPQMLRRFERLQRTGSVTDFRSIEVSAHSQTMMGLFGNITIISMVSTGGWLAVTGDMSVGTLAACTMLAGRTIQPVVKVAGIWNELQRTAISLEDIKELFFGTTDPKFEKVDLVVSEEERFRPSSLTAENISIVKGSRTLVNDLNLMIEPGSLIGIQAADGEGKSTLLRVLAGEIPPDNGVVKIDGLAPDDKNTMAGKISFAAASQGLFNGTILENLTLFGEGASIDDACWAVELVGLQKSVNALPLGFDTLVGSGNATPLASGFIQRIILARALAQRPTILFLDEPQAFLDYDSDRDVISGLQKLRGQMTIIMVTSRPSYLRVADKIFNLKDGKCRQQNKQKPAAQVAQKGAVA